MEFAWRNGEKWSEMEFGWRKCVQMCYSVYSVRHDAARSQHLCLVRLQLCNQAHCDIYIYNNSTYELWCVPNSTKPITCVNVIL